MCFVYRPWVWSIPVEGLDEDSEVVFEMCQFKTSHLDITVFKPKWS